MEKEAQELTFPEFDLSRELVGTIKSTAWEEQRLIEHVKTSSHSVESHSHY